MAVAPVTTATIVATDLPGGRYLEWGPIILGTLGSLAMLVVLMTFGTALGLTVVSPQPYAGISAKGLAVLAGVYAALVHVASFAAGGYLAGRMRTPWATTDLEERNFRDGGHGFGVWALGVVLGAALAASGIAGVVKTAVGATTAVAAAGTAGAASIRQRGLRCSCRCSRPTLPSIACSRRRRCRSRGRRRDAAARPRRHRRADRADLRGQHAEPATRCPGSHLSRKPGQPAHRDAPGRR